MFTFPPFRYKMKWGVGFPYFAVPSVEEARVLTIQWELLH